MKKGFPEYKSLRYYYNDKTTADFDYILKRKDNTPYNFVKVCGVIVITEYGDIFFNQSSGSIIVPDEFEFNEYIVPQQWLSPKEIKYAIDYQPYDFDDVWNKGHAMYSKELWNIVYRDIIDFKIDFIKGDLDLKGFKIIQ